MIAVASSTRQCKEYSGKGSFELAGTSIKRKRRGDEEVFEVVDDCKWGPKVFRVEYYPEVIFQDY